VGRRRDGTSEKCCKAATIICLSRPLTWFESLLPLEGKAAVTGGFFRFRRVQRQRLIASVLVRAGLDGEQRRIISAFPPARIDTLGSARRASRCTPSRLSDESECECARVFVLTCIELGRARLELRLEMRSVLSCHLIILREENFHSGALRQINWLVGNDLPISNVRADRLDLRQDSTSSAVRRSRLLLANRNG
jgi:hypothetical protein